MAKKVRADQLLVEKGLAETRERAKRLIMAGEVFLDLGTYEERVDKPGRQLGLDAPLMVKGRERFVSRGAYKLLTAIEEFGLELEGKVGLDAGASTGGFTDCLLQHGAARVFAVDVGYGQLHEKLRADDRVVNLERTNLRHLTDEHIDRPVDIVVADVSFISLTKILPPCMPFLKQGGEIAVLVKPQFELGPGMTEKGVVRDPALRQQAVDDVTAFCRERLGLSLVGCVPSKIKGPKGNQEYIVYMKRTGDFLPVEDDDMAEHSGID